ncbi:MAG: hypothetical protein J3K34DRAFT_408089 [Monoraphidium minutum]|nr:MAG: hypothetical protein J3K34DRAFT_408089 [Monoraphidium minutum]
MAAAAPAAAGRAPVGRPAAVCIPPAARMARGNARCVRARTHTALERPHAVDDKTFWHAPAPGRWHQAPVGGAWRACTVSAPRPPRGPGPARGRNPFGSVGGQGAAGASGRSPTLWPLVSVARSHPIRSVFLFPPAAHPKVAFSTRRPRTSPDPAPTAPTRAALSRCSNP